MQEYFHEISDFLDGLRQGSELLRTSFHAEDSDFVRFNHNQVRQAGHVTQREVAIDLCVGSRHVAARTSLVGNLVHDQERLRRVVARLRETVPHLPEDPHLLLPDQIRSSERIGSDDLPEAAESVSSVMKRGEGTDLVGLYSAGGIYSGFANSLGQRNWFASHSFNLDWSLYHRADKAVKSAYAGFRWSERALESRMALASEQLSILRQTPRTIDPGRYRVYLSPVAVYELLSTVAWGGFGLKSHRTKQTSLLRMVQGDAKLHPMVSLTENTAEGIAPDFQGEGFIKPARVPLIERGCFQTCLASPRSAKEYSVPTNGASGDETPESIDMAPGALPHDDVLSELGTGLYVNNLWYLNYSDRPACRITGMTRFATLWVENGKIVAPVNVMRFDESLYRMFGNHLAGLTAERELILDSDTYERRSTRSGRLPGALVEELTFTL